MLYDFLQLDRASTVPLWHQLYTGLQEAIGKNFLHAGEKLASIRQASAELRISRTTVETAYIQLCMEGYAESRPQSGYRVRQFLPCPSLSPASPPAKPKYDFGTSAMNLQAADLETWKKLVRAVLADQNTLISYGDPQGERCLRENLAGYAFRARGVLADPNCIFIGAGVGPLIQLLCPLFPEKPPVSMEGPGFPQAETIFRDYGFSVVTPQGPQASCFPNENSAIWVELPSLRPKTSSAAASAHRDQLAQWAHAHPNRYVLEDDYNGELHYRTRAVPAFQGFCPDKTVYLGSFSKLLVPSVRIAYMVLPPELAQKVQGRLKTLNQTAGKTEQLALAEYIRTGLLEKHLRRLRRLSSKKSQVLLQSLKTHFGANVPCCLYETHLSAVISVPANAEASALCAAALRSGIVCQSAPSEDGISPGIALGFSGIEESQIDAGICALKKAWIPFLV